MCAQHHTGHVNWMRCTVRIMTLELYHYFSLFLTLPQLQRVK